MKINVDIRNAVIENGKLIIELDEDNIQKFEKSFLTEVCSLNPGDKFVVNGEKFTVLDNTVGGVLVIADEFFGEACEFSGDNNWSHSPIRVSMNSGDIYHHMCNLFGAKNILSMTRDLTSLDGLDDYGICIDKVSMLTTFEYARYHKILGANKCYSGGWWTVTPHSTPSNDSTDCVCYVDHNGLLFPYDYDCELYIRPVLTLVPNTLVSKKV